jgi:EAL domain-containing protein (putative c-di-GMP-specific phosphodiesterase class I)
MPEQIFQRLLQVVKELHAETASLTAQESELQLWYNRGYADGMIEAMQSLGFKRQLDDAGVAIDMSLINGQELLPWGKAYQHGFEMGEKETEEVLT